MVAICFVILLIVSSFFGVGVGVSKNDLMLSIINLNQGIYGHAVITIIIGNIRQPITTFLLMIRYNITC